VGSVPVGVLEPAAVDALPVTGGLGVETAAVTEAAELGSVAVLTAELALDVAPSGPSAFWVPKPWPQATRQSASGGTTATSLAERRARAVQSLAVDG